AAPKIRAFTTRHPNVELISLSMDEDLASLNEFLKGHELPGKPLHYPGGLQQATQIGINNVPLFILVDERGQVAGVAEGSRDVEGKLERLLAKLAPTAP